MIAEDDPKAQEKRQFIAQGSKFKTAAAIQKWADIFDEEYPHEVKVGGRTAVTGKPGSFHLIPEPKEPKAEISPSHLLSIYQHGLELTKTYGPQPGSGKSVNEQLYQQGLDMMKNPKTHYNKIVNGEEALPEEAAPKSRTEQMREAQKKLQGN